MEVNQKDGTKGELTDAAMGTAKQEQESLLRSQIDDTPCNLHIKTNNLSCKTK